MKSGKRCSLRFGLLWTLLTCSAHLAFAQKTSYAPFIINEQTVTATLKVKDTPIEAQFAEVFRKYRRNASSPADWYELISNIAGMKETDLYSGKEISIESTEDGVEISGINMDNLEQIVTSIRLTIMTPQKVDAFLTYYEALLKKKK